LFVHVRHVTRYTYSKAVFCEPMTVRLYPRHDASQHVHSYQLQMLPAPAGMSSGLDIHDNNSAKIWFQGLSSNLIITSDAVVETLRTNPYDFLLDREASLLPHQLGGPREPLLDYFARPEGDSPGVRALAEEVLAEVERQTIGFICRLADRIYHECETVVRDQGMSLPAEETWQARCGACRDQAVLFNEACRAVGLPARFVSGYSLSTIEDHEERHLHAWSEVYLPGAGWRGFDPTTGLAVADEHVAVATGRLPHHAAPTHGTFRGTEATSTIETQIVLRHMPEPPATVSPQVTPSDIPTPAMTARMSQALPR
jgi:transglutaminase-like putative cysteine protease